MHVPLIIAGEKRGGYYWDRNCGNCDVLCSSMDIAPTSLGLCGLPVPDWMEGSDLSWTRDLDRKAEPRTQSLYLQSILPTHHFDSVDKPWRSVITDDGYKYVAFPGTDWMLFNLHNDPYEQMNLAHNPVYREHRTQMREILHQWILKTQDDFRPPYDA